MAVPKKRTSKMKKNLRKSVWRKQTHKQALKALSIGKSLLKKQGSIGGEDSIQKGFTKKTLGTSFSES